MSEPVIQIRHAITQYGLWVVHDASKPMGRNLLRTEGGWQGDGSCYFSSEQEARECFRLYYPSPHDGGSVPEVRGVRGGYYVWRYSNTYLGKDGLFFHFDTRPFSDDVNIWDTEEEAYRALDDWYCRHGGGATPAHRRIQVHDHSPARQ